jgi:NAD(P)-dependent dehydrogenase (short-subunit alcohol dehydrogenase family)
MGQKVLAWKINATGKPAEEIVAAAAAGNPLGRNCTEADVTNAILFFLSDASDFLTGLALDVDGGLLGTIPLPGTQG